MVTLFEIKNVLTIFHTPAGRENNCKHDASKILFLFM